jgi:hypothetical protein
MEREIVVQHQRLRRSAGRAAARPGPWIREMSRSGISSETDLAARSLMRWVVPPFNNRLSGDGHTLLVEREGLESHLWLMEFKIRVKPGLVGPNRRDYCLATAIMNRSSAPILWSASLAAASMSICTHLTLPLNALSRGP